MTALLGSMLGPSCGRQKRQDSEDRDHRDVLEEQHRERTSAARGPQQAFLTEGLKHDGGRRESQG